MNDPMRATLDFIAGAKLSLMLKIAVVPVLCSWLCAGCVTSSQDDYVASVLADAMQGLSPEGEDSPARAPEAGIVGEPAVPAAPTPVTPPFSIAAPPPVTVPAPVVVSVQAPAVVSIPTPAAPVTVVTKPGVRDQKAEAPVPVVKISTKDDQAGTQPTKSEGTPVVKASEGATSVPPGGSQEVQKTGATDGGRSADPERRPEARDGKPYAAPRPAIPTIQPDSVLWVSVTEDPSLNGRYMVNDASAIDFGYVGLVFLSDMTVEQAQSELERVLEGRYLKNATVSVKLAKASYDRVGIQGAVEMPGDIKIGPGATIALSEALRRAGGLRGNRENSRVKIIRGGLKTPFGPAAEGDVYSLVTQDGQLKVPDVFLRNDDMAYVFSPSTEVVQGQARGGGVTTGAGGKRVVLLGEVPRRGVVEFSENEPCTLMYLLFKIGGLPRFAKADKITVVRRNKDGTEKSFLVDGEKLLNNGKPEDDLVLETGDRIVVPARKISFF